MQTHTHKCCFCGTSEVVEVKNPHTKLPEKWRWMTLRKEGQDAEPVCNECWTRNMVEIILERVGKSGTQRITGGRVRKCCG